MNTIKKIQFINLGINNCIKHGLRDEANEKLEQVLIKVDQLPNTHEKEELQLNYNAMKRDLYSIHDLSVMDSLMEINNYMIDELLNF